MESNKTSNYSLAHIANLYKLSVIEAVLHMYLPGESTYAYTQVTDRVNIL